MYVPQVDSTQACLASICPISTCRCMRCTHNNDETSKICNTHCHNIPSGAIADKLLTLAHVWECVCTVNTHSHTWANATHTTQNTMYKYIFWCCSCSQLHTYTCHMTYTCQLTQSGLESHRRKVKGETLLCSCRQAELYLLETVCLLQMFEKQSIYYTT